MTTKQKGLYVVADKDAAKAYIGSTIDKHNRFRRHDSELRNNRHHNKELQDAYNAGHRFEVTFIPVEEHVNVVELEQKLLDEFVPAGILYNRAISARAPNMGLSDSDETRAKKSAARKGIPQSADLIEKRAAANRGQKRSSETCERIGAAKRGNTFWLGKSHSEHSRELIRQARSKPVIVDGTRYESISSAAEAHGISVASAQKRVVNPNTKWDNWMYVQNPNPSS